MAGLEKSLFNLKVRLNPFLLTYLPLLSFHPSLFSALPLATD